MSAAYSVTIINETSTNFKLYHYGIYNGLTHQHPSPLLKAGATEYLSWNTIKPDDHSTPSSGHAYWVAKGQTVFAIQMNGYKSGNVPHTMFQYSVPVGNNDVEPSSWIRPYPAPDGWPEPYSFCFAGEGDKKYKLTVASYEAAGRLYTVNATIEDLPEGFW